MEEKIAERVSLLALPPDGQNDSSYGISWQTISLIIINKIRATARIESPRPFAGQKRLNGFEKDGYLSLILRSLRGWVCEPCVGTVRWGEAIKKR